MSKNLLSSMSPFSDSEIIRSWHTNATPWVKAIQQGEIESRKLITNQAIIDLVLDSSPTTLLDMGCGEGWLARALTRKSIKIFGIDASPKLIEDAKKINNAQFDVCTYENLSSYQFDTPFDCIICNFSLIGKEATEAVINISKKLLTPNGKLIIQTLHPLMACGNFPYQDGWREGSWDGFSSDFKNPAPWYFRTIESWCNLLIQNGFHIKILEPLHPLLKKPASIIFGCNIK
jgi:2-polyprenyl-3-methyl-5-hydroxy-6-metoxy-1,4-benzoquinol methylase